MGLVHKPIFKYLYDIMNDLFGSQNHHQRFRYYSRAILCIPSASMYHKKRIAAAKKFSEGEPLQGAISDYFYSCWYDLPHIDPEITKGLEARLGAQAWQIIADCLEKKYYLKKTNLLATRWSVLTTPTLDVPSHKLRASTDDATHLANAITHSLMDAQAQQDTDEIARLEDEFFDHCLACHDIMAFLKAWFKLAKHNWVFDKRWSDCRKQLEQSAPTQITTL